MIDPMEPYALPTERASRALAEQMLARGAQWWVPCPQDDAELADFRTFFVRHGGRVVDTAPLFNDWEADRDTSPYVFAWRLGRGEITLTDHGCAQYGRKEPFRSALAALP